MSERLPNGQFPKGRSGNPAGRPKSASTELRRSLAEHGTAVVEKVVSAALAGDMTAAKVVIDRLLPPLKAQPAPIHVDLEGADGLAGVSRRLVDEAAAGRVPADVASQLVAALGQVARITEIDELERRLAALESAQ
ncbi:DUF5681 domain-containing protein [Halomonas saccharevitans]|uniref:DUF5681 domain-containing protein n=1 Tax=Halomonas saccharevitans TaxID=416872 RepID=A0ABU3NBV2_9GAMM|nr:DUF5681 domain-containing protein [Halomonas saccharevitans]MDT8878522.1 DUF5681 domain-containing protein [Halomonas saccharevitans]